MSREEVLVTLVHQEQRRGEEREDRFLVVSCYPSSLPPFVSPTVLPLVMLIHTAILLICCAITCDLRSTGSLTNIREDDHATLQESNRVARSVSSGHMTTKTGIGRPGRFGSSQVARVLTLNYVSSPGSYGYRRSYTEPEPLLCIGGNNDCNFTPTSIQCYHKRDGNGWHWQCESEQMNSTLCFDTVDITCDSEVPSEFIWTSGDRTPCRMLYTINRLESDDPYEKKLQCSANHYDAEGTFTARPLPGILSLTLSMLVIGLILFGVFTFWTSREDSSTVPKLPFQNKTSTDSSNSSGDSSIYPHLSKEINSDNQPSVSVLFQRDNSSPSLRCHSR